MERRSIAVRGIVQGVGFRPFVYGLAGQLGLRGSVRNRAGEVLIEVEGLPSALDRFLDGIAGSPPPLARIEDLSFTVERGQGFSRLEPRSGEPRFRIEASEAVAARGLGISPDVAPCEHCLAELHDPADRRYGYPFLNCTQCGPRLTITLALPYDRERTTLAAFTLCPECRTEYENPENRRFHAQPIACPACGPQLLWKADGGGDAADPLAAAARTIAAGGLVAIKGLGGFHLACDAAQEIAVDRLRAGKGRGDKPFALMVPDLATASRLCELDETAERWLAAPERPVVLLPRCPGAAVAPGVAPGGALLGLLLPYSPLHSLLMERLGRPIVLTSGNRSGEPMAVEEDEAVARLGDLADGFLTHDRPIAVRCDDSVVRWTGRRVIPIRRSRGWTPRPVKVGFETVRPVLALGGQEKNTFCMLRAGDAVLSHHIGDLDTVEAIRDLRSALSHYQRLLDFAPQVVACDLHPDYASTNLARELAARGDLPLVPVQHHHAHVLSVLAEHRLAGPALGIVLDGSGLGTDGTVWGCEFLAVAGARMARLGHLERVRLPGGEAAVREPWRMAVAWLLQAWGGELPALDLPVLAAEPRARRAVERLVAHGIQAPLASSAGRLFDAVAALLGLRRRASFEGQAAMELEALAAAGPAPPYPFALEAAADGFELCFSPAIRALAEEAAGGGDPGRISARFHRTLVDALAASARRAREEHGLELAVLAGGCFQNALLLEGARDALAAAGFKVLVPVSVPPNDGGLALGQAVAAAAEELPACV
jgi:hydrogenase maturation protein HypF